MFSIFLSNGKNLLSAVFFSVSPTLCTLNITARHIYCRIKVLERSWKSRVRNNAKQRKPHSPSAFRYKFPVRIFRYNCNVINTSLQQSK